MSKLSAVELYQKAMDNGVYLECTCVGIEQREWDKLMKGAVRADKKKVLKAIGVKEEHRNPYESFRTQTHLIYVHSAIEHFYRIQ